jgi:fructose-1,6-bisphosphatase/inositol monophosphatase family enzyme
MMDPISDFQNFLENELLPAALQSLAEKYAAYCQGEDLKIEQKSDDTPASLADRETERILREPIKERFPDHGIWGEEFGAEKTEADYVWILDPLDGTREFLDKKPGCFGTLIGLVYQGKPILGAIGDPISREIYIAVSNNFQSPKDDKVIYLQQAILSCTAPDGMFKTQPLANNFKAIQSQVAQFIPELNCMGFAAVATGDMDLAIEADLKIHDIIPVLPVLWAAGCATYDEQGRDYRDIVFDLSNESKKYTIITAGQNDLAVQALATLKFEEAA